MKIKLARLADELDMGCDKRRLKVRPTFLPKFLGQWRIATHSDTLSAGGGRFVAI